MSSAPAPANSPRSSSGNISPADKVVFVPDALFFFRRIEIPDGLAPNEREDLIQLSLEQYSPFPLAQMYYGYFQPAGSRSALIYAAYRKKIEGYAHLEEESDFVFPSLAITLGHPQNKARRLLVTTPESLSLVVFADADPVPLTVVTRYRDEEAGDLPGNEEIDRLYRLAGLSREIDREWICRNPGWNGWESKQAAWSWLAGEKSEPVGQTSTLTKKTLESLDIRDKDFLFQRRAELRKAAQFRMAFYALVAILLLLLVGEAALFGGRVLLDRSQTEVAERAPAVQRIQEEDLFANRMEEISENRLVPFAMLEVVNRLRPRSITFSRAEATGNMTLDIVANTANNSDLLRFADALETSDEVAGAEVVNQSVRDGQTTFRMRIRFRPVELISFFEDQESPAVEMARRDESDDDPSLPEVSIRDLPSRPTPSQPPNR